MRVAGENAEELTAFLEKDDNPDRKKLLDSLTKKDNKDLRAEVLEDHLSAKRGSWSEDIHVQDPAVSYTHLTLPTIRLV